MNRRKDHDKRQEDQQIRIENFERGQDDHERREDVKGSLSNIMVKDLPVSHGIQELPQQQRKRTDTEI